MASMSDIILANEEKFNYLHPLVHTDKDTAHSYIDYVYSKVFSQIKDDTKKLLELGVLAGSSLHLWKDYFSNAHIYGCDINPQYFSTEKDERITVYGADAYQKDFVDTLENDFDIIIDDGPHTLETMIFFVKNYPYKVKSGGLLIIEDIPDINWISSIIENIPDNYKCSAIQLYDLRHIKNRSDDILMIITI